MAVCVIYFDGSYFENVLLSEYVPAAPSSDSFQRFYIITNLYAYTVKLEMSEVM